MLRASNSTIKKWKQCKRAYNYHLVENLEPKVHSIQLYRGTIIHKMIETHAKGGDWKEHLKEVESFLSTLWVEELEDISEYHNLQEDLEIIMQGYFERYKNDGLTYLHTELELEYPIVPGRAILTAKVDGLVRRESDQTLWIMEHKSHKKFPSDEFRFTSTQPMIYFWLLKKLGYPKISGVIWDYVRTVAPSVPRELKNGKPSLALKSIASTDYATFRKFLIDRGHDLSDYREHLDVLKQDDEKFYRRVWLPLNNRMVTEVMRDMHETILEMVALEGKSISRNLSEWNCRGCGYKNLCFTQLVGGDVEFVKKREYQQRSRTLSIDAGSDEEPQDDQTEI